MEPDLLSVINMASPKAVTAMCAVIIIHPSNASLTRYKFNFKFMVPASSTSASITKNMAQASPPSLEGFPDEIWLEILGNLFTQPVKADKYSIKSSRAFVNYYVSILSVSKRPNQLGTSEMRKAFQQYGLEYVQMLPCAEKCLDDPGIDYPSVSRAHKAHAAFLQRHSDCVTSVTVHGSWRANYSFQWFTNLQNLRLVELSLNIAIYGHEQNLSPSHWAYLSFGLTKFPHKVHEGQMLVMRMLKDTTRFEPFIRDLIKATQTQNYRRILEFKVGLIVPSNDSPFRYRRPTSSCDLQDTCKIWVRFSRGHTFFETNILSRMSALKGKTTWSTGNLRNPLRSATSPEFNCEVSRADIECLVGTSMIDPPV
jgi:hypothetical protein